MISIDKIAYLSKLKNTNPMEKFIFSIVTMIVCIVLNNIIDSIMTLIIMSYMTLIKGKTPANAYFKLMSLPLFFLIIGVLTIAINVVGNNNDLIFSFNIFSVKLGSSKEGLYKAGILFFKSLGAVSCLYFLTLTTPITEILSVLRKLRVPKLFVELMGLIYRFIFVLLDTANMIYVSQNSRLGYSNFRTSFNSLGQLIAALFISSYKRSQDIYIAMEARCYDGDINLLENRYLYSRRNIILIVVVQLVLIITSLN